MKSLMVLMLVLLLSLVVVGFALAAHTNCPEGWVPGHTTAFTPPDKDGDGDMCKKTVELPTGGQLILKIDDIR